MTQAGASTAAAEGGGQTPPRDQLQQDQKQH